MKGILRGVWPAFASALCATGAFIHSPTELNSNASIAWSQLGNPGDLIPQDFAVIAASRPAVLGALSGLNGTVAKACPAINCNYFAGTGIGAGEFLLWTENANGSGTGPLTFAFSNPVRGAGLYLELTAPGSFSAGLIVTTETGQFTESVPSNSFGDPVFLGYLDPTADLLSLEAGIFSCAPSSPGGCDPSDFGIGTLSLATAVPEPSSFFLLVFGLVVVGFVYGSRSFSRGHKIKRVVFVTPLWTLFLLVAPPAARAQKPISDQAGDAQFMDGIRTVQSFPAPALGLAQDTAVNLPTWKYSLASPLSGFIYGGYMVGGNPFNRGGRTITIPTILIPVIVTFHNTTTGFITTFDPSSTPDEGCTAGLSALNLVESSPVFQSNDWVMNGVDVGTTQYMDAIQRASFWQYVRNSGDSNHVLLTYTEGEPLQINVDYATPTLAAEIRTGVAGSCTNPNSTGSVNGKGYQGFVSQTTIDPNFRDYISTHAIAPNQLPIFVLYNTVMPKLTTPTFFTGGYHSALAGFPQRFTSPGQTYIVADFQTNLFYAKPILDVSLLTHELAEWLNDPGLVNGTPAWGNIGQVSGCQGDLEVGDPLTGTNLPSVVGPNGFEYHLQELAFFSWFFRTSSIGAGGVYSSNGTFATDAGPECH